MVVTTGHCYEMLPFRTWLQHHLGSKKELEAGNMAATRDLPQDPSTALGKHPTSNSTLLLSFL
jgi:hypothetical protein